MSNFVLGCVFGFAIGFTPFGLILYEEQREKRLNQIKRRVLGEN